MTREEAIKLVYKIRIDIFKHLDTKELTALDMAIEALADRPTGKWIGDKCSMCGSERAWYGGQPDYCPDCGAKMVREERKDD